MTTQFHVLSFEGPDPYARAGGLATRVTGLTRALADNGYETHLWFVGDPYLAGHETLGQLKLHRWCQWISRHHPAGVYDGDEGKQRDYAASLPPHLLKEVLAPCLRSGRRAVFIAEEWQTVDAVLHLDRLLRIEGLRGSVVIIWNANNTFGFHRIDWKRLARAAVITTVSRYMRALMRPLGVEALVVPNGLSADAFLPPQPEALEEFESRLRHRTVLCKMARWDPDKSWLTAIDITCELKRLGAQPLLVARGGLESYGDEVLKEAGNHRLRVVERETTRTGPSGLLELVEDVEGADMVNLRTPVDSESRRVLFRGSAAVLANSAHEPFGLVGLETMAAGGVACTGGTGEDYAEPDRNALVLASADSREFVTRFRKLKSDPDSESALRRAGRMTAERYGWPRILKEVLLPQVRQLNKTDAVAV
jgi:glycosyltransferase involved in cell wall biosynthesis